MQGEGITFEILALMIKSCNMISKQVITFTTKNHLWTEGD